MTVLPIRLEGDNLGKRHRYFNKMVNEAFARNIPFDSIKNIPEVSTLDRLFKIELASKHREVDYIINNVKDNDMLYVSKALNSSWLIKDSKYGHIVNPYYLENTLYPSMTTTAVTKMKKKIFLNLRDKQRCRNFYEYYKQDQLTYALKFLPYCEETFLLKEMENISEHIRPHYLKLLCETTPTAGKLYFTKIVRKHIDRQYYSNEHLIETTMLLKTSPEIYFQIIEKIFINRAPLNSKISKYILKNHKDKFDAKPEFYSYAILDLKTLGKFLSTEEIKELVIKLARAEYLNHWFRYRTIEPLLQQMDKQEKTAFVKKIFVEKDIGEKVKESPYEFPCFPGNEMSEVFSQSTQSFPESSLNYEEDNCLISSEGICRRKQMTMCLASLAKCSRGRGGVPIRSLLDELFDKYRFDSFSKTFFELKKLLVTETFHMNRMMIMNVLVSKSAGKEDQVKQLMEFLTQRHYNEPINVRAAVVRSLVKRTRVFLLSEECWKLVTKFMHSVDLDDCKEYIHATVMRHAMLQQPFPESLTNDFLENFDVQCDYKLTGPEKKVIREYIYNLLVNIAKKNLQENKIEDVCNIMWKTFQVLDEMKVHMNSNHEIVDIVKTLVQINEDMSRDILSHLYNKKICRIEFIKENFSLKQNDASYVNVLRHDVNLLDDTNKFEELLSSGELKHDTFLKKLSIYFDDQLAKKHLTILEDRIKSDMNSKERARIGRCICILKGSQLLSLVKSLQSDTKNRQALAASLCNNLQHMRPKLQVAPANIEEFGEQAANNLLSTVSSDVVDQYVPALLSTKQKSYIRLALTLSFRALASDQLAAVLSSLDKSHYVMALLIAIPYIRNKKSEIPKIVWDQIRKIIEQIKLTKKRHLLELLTDVEKIPSAIKTEFCAAGYNAINKLDFQPDTELEWSYLHPVLKYIAENVPSFDSHFITELLERFFKMKLDRKSLKFYNYYLKKCEKTFIIILCKHILLTTDEDILINKIQQFVVPLLKLIKYWHQSKTEDENDHAKEDLQAFLRYMKCNKIYFSHHYVSPMPLFVTVGDILKEFLPVEKHFKIYSHLHLTMLYYKSAKQCIKQWPDIINDSEVNDEKTIEKLGVVFGRYIAHELVQLISQYFSSIIWLYKSNIMSYVQTYTGDGDIGKIFKRSIIKGLLEDKLNSDAIFMAVILRRDWELEDECVKDFEFVKDLNNDEITFFYKFNQRKLTGF